jgi:hypothetical protein
VFDILFEYDDMMVPSVQYTIPEWFFKWFLGSTGHKKSPALKPPGFCKVKTEA